MSNDLRKIKAQAIDASTLSKNFLARPEPPKLMKLAKVEKDEAVCFASPSYPRINSNGK
jgi:hypothetical protein